MKEEEDKKSFRTGKILIVVLIIAFFAGAVGYDTLFGRGVIKNTLSSISLFSNGTSETSGASVSLEADSSVKFVTIGENVAACSRDGIRYYTTLGSQKWNDTYTMNAIMVVQEGNYIAVGETMGRNLRLYNQEGLVYAKNMPAPIVGIYLNEAGCMAVIMNNSDQYHLQIFYETGSMPMEIPEFDKGVYPLSADISSDNRVLAVSYLDTTDIQPVTKVLLYYIDKEEGEAYTNSMFAGVEKDNVITPVIKYVSGDILIGVSDRSLFALDIAGNTLWEAQLTNQIDAVCFSQDDIIVAYGQEFANEDGKAIGTVEWFSHEGEIHHSYEAGGKVKYLRAYGDGAILGVDNDYRAINSSGNVVWDYKATQEVRDIFILDRPQNALVVTNTSAFVMDMSRQQAVEESQEQQDNDSLQLEEGQTEESQDAAAEDNPTGTDSQDIQLEATPDTQAGAAQSNENAAADSTEGIE